MQEARAAQQKIRRRPSDGAGNLPSNARLCPARLVARRRMQEYERPVIEVWNGVNRGNQKEE